MNYRAAKVRTANRTKALPACRGFTLVELLMVIVIIGVLSGMLMLSSNASVDLSQKNVCAGNRRVIRSAYIVKAAENGKPFAATVTDVMADYPKAKEAEVSEKGASYSGLCPSGGNYVLSVDAETGRVSCICTFKDHQTEAELEGFPLLVDFGDKLGEILKSGMTTAEKIAAIKKLLGAYAATYLNNTDIRNALLASLKGSWPAVEKDSDLYKALAEIKGLESGQYIQPYFPGGQNEPIYWVSNSATTQGAWNAYAIYYNGKWYQPPNNVINIANSFNQNKPAEQLLKEIGMLDDKGEPLWKQIG